MKKFDYGKLMIEMQTRVLKSAPVIRAGKYEVLADADENNIYFCVGGSRLYAIMRSRCYLDPGKFKPAGVGQLFRKARDLADINYYKPAGIVLTTEGIKAVKFIDENGGRVYVQEKFINEFSGIEHVYLTQERGARLGPCVVRDNYIHTELGLVMPFNPNHVIDK